VPREMEVADCWWLWFLDLPGLTVSVMLVAGALRVPRRGWRHQRVAAAGLAWAVHRDRD
jgi:hypothetical protein